jgi:hypothetical protein
MSFLLSAILSHLIIRKASMDLQTIVLPPLWHFSHLIIWKASMDLQTNVLPPLCHFISSDHMEGQYGSSDDCPSSSLAFSSSSLSVSSTVGFTGKRPFRALFVHAGL